MSKLLHIFRVGKHTATNGMTLDFTESMLRDAATAYDPAVHEAPLVVGHPRDDAPAYGWAKSLQFADGVIQAEPDQVEPTFAEMVNAGRFKKISASWYLPDAPNNPKPGTLYLRHVGFLGALPPAVKGLKSASFAEQEQGVVEFGDWSDMQVASMFRRVREFIISKFSMEDADGVIPTYAIESLEASAQSNAQASPAYSETTVEQPMNAAELAAREQAITQREQAIAERETNFGEREQRISAQERVQRRVAYLSFAEGLITGGKLLPAHKDGIVAFMESLDGSGVVEFGEGDKAVKQPALEWFKSYLTQQPKFVSYGEDTRLNDATEKGTASFAAPAGFSVDVESIDKHNKALAYQAEHPDTTYFDAVKAVST